MDTSLVQLHHYCPEWDFKGRTATITSSLSYNLFLLHLHQSVAICLLLASNTSCCQSASKVSFYNFSFTKRWSNLLFSTSSETHPSSIARCGIWEVLWRQLCQKVIYKFGKEIWSSVSNAETCLMVYAVVVAQCFVPIEKYRSNNLDRHPRKLTSLQPLTIVNRVWELGENLQPRPFSPDATNSSI
jgi:hypothetical protein